MKELGHPHKSNEIGKTTAIPYLKNMGIHPIRSSITPYVSDIYYIYILILVYL